MLSHQLHALFGNTRFVRNDSQPTDHAYERERQWAHMGKGSISFRDRSKFPSKIHNAQNLKFSTL